MNYPIIYSSLLSHTNRKVSKRYTHKYLIENLKTIEIIILNMTTTRTF